MAELPDDPAVEALTALVEQLRLTTAELDAAIERANELVERRAAGAPWREIVASERRPLVVERISNALDALGAAGSRFRREEARALAREDLNITEISRMFGVSRQRVSALVQDQSGAAPPR